jgi:hypothetical protein
MNELFSSIPFFNGMPTWDVLLIFLFLVSGFFYGVFFGRARLLALVLGLYFGIALTYTVPNLLPIQGQPFTQTAQMIVFVTGTIVSYVIIYTSLLKKRRHGEEGWWQVFIISFLSMGLTASVITRLLPITIQNEFSEIVYMLVLSDAAFLVWHILPMLAVLIASRRVE